MKSVISTAFAPFAIIERIRRDACSIGFVFVDASGNDLDISGQDYQVLFVRDGGFTTLTKTAVHALTNRLEITLTDAEKDQLRDPKYGLVLYNVTASRTELNAVFTWQQGRQSSAGVLSPPDLKIRLNIVTGDAEVAGLIITGIQGSRGWSPVLGNVPTGIRVVQQLLDWVGGQGVKPAITGVGGAPLYIKNTGFTTIIADATDVRGIQGYAGWTAILGNVINGVRVVQQLLDWVGGTGTKPAITGDGGAPLYISATGLTITIADATDVRGLQGYAGWTAIFANVPDGARIVQRLADMVGGTGTKPAITGDGGVPLYLGSAGLTTTLANATDIRGPIGFNWQGSYTVGTNYVAADAFVFRGSAYRVNNPFAGALPFSRTNVTRILRGVNPTGAHQTNTQYYIDDLATDSGNTYIRLTDGLSGASFPGVGADWALWAQKGDPGTLTASAFAVIALPLASTDKIVIQRADGTMGKIDPFTTGFPDIRPSVLFDFANSRMVSPRLIFSRNTAVARFNAAGNLEAVGANVPRINHDYLTKRCLGYLAEDSRQIYAYGSLINLGTGSTQTGLTVTVSAAGTEYGMTYKDVTISGTATTGGYTNITWGNNPVTAGTAYTSSVFTKIISGSFSNELMGSLGGAGFGTFAPNTPTTTTLKRLWVTGTPTSNNTLYPCWGCSMNTGVVSNLVIRFYAPQVEVGTYPTSPLLTTTTVTRALDLCRLPVSSSWFNPEEGTMFVEVRHGVTGSSGIACGLGSGSGDGIHIRQTTTGVFGMFRNTTLAAGDTGQGSWTPGAIVRYVVTWKNGSPVKFYMAGGSYTSGNNYTTAHSNTWTWLAIGNFADGGGQWNDHILKFACWTKELPQSQCQTLVL